MLAPQNRFATLTLAAGALVLLIAIAAGERMGDRVMVTATDRSLQSAVRPVEASPDPSASPGPYGPNWKRMQTLAAAQDPRFPDPRVPPEPLPTPLPVRTEAPAPATPTPNPNIPVWRQQPLPTVTPSAEPSPGEPSSPAPTGSGSPPPP